MDLRTRGSGGFGGWNPGGKDTFIADSEPRRGEGPERDPDDLFGVYEWVILDGR